MNFIVRMRVKMYVVRARLHGEKRRPEIRLQFASCVYTVPEKFFNGRLFLLVQPVSTELCNLCYRLQYCLSLKKLTQFRGSRVNERQNRASFLSFQTFFSGAVFIFSTFVLFV